MITYFVKFVPRGMATDIDGVDAKLRQEGLGSLAVLPDHLVSYITFMLELEDVVRASCTSRLLRVFCCEEPLWLGLCLRAQQGPVVFKVSHSWQLPADAPKP